MSYIGINHAVEVDPYGPSVLETAYERAAVDESIDQESAHPILAAEAHLIGKRNRPVEGICQIGGYTECYDALLPRNIERCAYRAVVLHPGAPGGLLRVRCEVRLAVDLDANADVFLSRVRPLVSAR